MTTLRHALAVLAGSAGLALGSLTVVAVPATGGAPDDATTGAPTTQQVDYSQVTRTLRREIPQIMAQAGIVGATVSLVDGDRVIMARGFGWADKAKARRVNAETLFHIGSLSKTFAALSVMQLVERGKVDLDAPMTRYVPELRLLPRFPGNTITVRSVLDHHSGIPGDIFYGLITLEKPDRNFHSWLLDTLRTMPPERRVNTTWAYNNSGYVLLQALVENVTGQPYARRTARTLFGRMDMASSTFDDTRAPNRAMTRNYSPVLGADGQPTRAVRVDPREYVNGWTAGSILSSARDMANYLRTLVHRGDGPAGRVVRKQTLRRMTTPQTHLTIDGDVHIGLSWFLTDSWLGRTFGHDGATTRNFSMLSVAPNQELGVFVSTNTVGGSAVADAIASRAMELAYTAKTGVPKPPPVALPDPGPRTPSPAELTEATGTYAGYTDYSTVRAVGDSLELTIVSGAERKNATFTQMADGWWKTSVDPDLQITFRTISGRHVMMARNGGGTRMNSMVLGQKVTPIRAPERWVQAAGTYRARLSASHATDLVPRTARLRFEPGLALLELGPAAGPERQVLLPFDADHAFTFGLASSGGRRKGDIVRLDDGRIVYMGVTYRKVG